MFPAMRVKIMGLDPHQQYYIAMDIIPVDNKRYRWDARSWTHAVELNAEEKGNQWKKERTKQKKNYINMNI